MQSHTTTASTADAGAAAGNVRAASAGAVARVQEMATIVKDYAVKYGEAAPEGQLLGAIKEDLLQAAEKLEQQISEKDAPENVYVTQARANASAGLMLVAAAVDKASTFDSQYQVTQSLAKSLQFTYVKALELLSRIQLSGGAVQGSLRRCQEALMTTSGDLTVALEKTSEHPALASARAVLEQALQEVKASLAELEGAPLTEKPVVAGLQALALARKGLAGATAIVTDARDGVLAAGPVAASLEKASATVTATREQLFALLHSVTARAHGLLKSVEASALSTAVALDKRFGVLDKAAALDAKYGVVTMATELAAQGMATAEWLDERFALQARAAGMLDSVRGIDKSITGGVFTPLLDNGLELAAQGATAGVQYAQEVQQKFMVAREGGEAAPQHAKAE